MELEKFLTNLYTVEETKKQLHKDLRDHFYELVQLEVFSKHPLLQSFSWTQYTPYYNDGDLCNFGAGINYLDVVFGEEKFNDLNSFAFNPIGLEWHKKEQNVVGLKEAYQDVAILLAKFSNDTYLHVFGDHTRVTVTNKEVLISDYSHD